MQHSPRRAAGTRISRVPITGSQDHLSSPSLRTPVGGSIRRQVGSKSMKLFCRRGHMPTDGARAEVTRGSSAARHHDALCSRPHRIACRSVHHTFSQILPLNGPHMPPPAQSRPGPAVWHAPFGACSGACVLSASPSSDAQLESYGCGVRPSHESRAVRWLHLSSDLPRRRSRRDEARRG